MTTIANLQAGRAAADEIVAWQCIGCGNIEAPQTCVGVCEYRKVRFVYADDHARAMAEVNVSAAALHRFVQKIASIRPREGLWETSFRALQEEARQLLRASAPSSPT